MPALFFPNLDALRLALVSGLVPPEVARAPARAGFDALGRLWLEPDELPTREAFAALARLGVLALGTPGVPTERVRCWAEVFPLRRTEPAADGLVLFDVPDRQLAALVARLRRREAQIGVRLLPDPYTGRAWVTAPAPAPAVFLWLDETGTDVRVYQKQTEGVWIVRGWEHPLAAHLSVQDGSVLLCGPDRASACVPGPVPPPLLEELPVPLQRTTGTRADPRVRIEVRFRLAKRDGPRDEALWVLAGAERDAFEAFCRTADERLLRRFQVATVQAGPDERLVVRRADAADNAAVRPAAVRGFQADPRAPTLFVPTGSALRPVVRVRELVREFALGPHRIVWIEPAERGISVHSVEGAAFRPLDGRLEYVVPRRGALAADELPEETFPFTRFTVQIETSIEVEPDPGPEEPEPVAEGPVPGGAGDDPSWVSKSVLRMVRWVRGQRLRAERAERVAAEPPADPTRPAPRPPQRPAAAPNDGRVERKLASADALLHGHDWAARRHDLETRLLADFAQLDPGGRAARWAELAGVYGATGQSLDAAVCWTNALWEAPAPPEAWFEQWAAAEIRAAKRGERGADLDRWLSEPARPGTGRVVAALAAYFGSLPVPPPEFIAALPRVQAVLEQQFDDVPVRGAWLARLALARACDGDTLGLARWRDRLIRRLHERGPALDLDEPSFLRVHGTATAERFKTAREWLVRMHEPIIKWVRRHAEGRAGLEWVGLSGEGEATAAYAQFMLAWGLGALGERAQARDWAARARKSLGRATGARADPAGHAFLGDLFLHRIKEAHEGHTPKPGLPAGLHERLERLPEFARYSADRLREHCRILQPVGAVRAYRGRDLREFWGPDRLGERLAVLGTRDDPTQLLDEARALLAGVLAEPGTATVPRVTLALLGVAAHFDASVTESVLGLVPTALDWTEAWVGAGRWAEDERANRVTRFQARIIELAFAVASAGAAQRLLRHIARGAEAGPLLAAAAATAPRAFRAARKFGLTSDAEALIGTIDPNAGEPTAALTAERVGLAVGWFVAGDAEAGERILNAAREALFYSTPDDVSKRTALALAYAEALGFATTGFALGRLEELFQRLERVTVQGSSNCYYTLHPLRLIDTVVRAVVTDEFTLSPGVRAWLDGDEFLIRGRIHRDLAARLRESELE